MNASLLQLLRDSSGLSFAVRDAETAGTEIVSGVLVGAGGERHAIRNGIPRFVERQESAQMQTADSFGFKWAQTETYSSPPFRRVMKEWLIERYGFGSEVATDAFFGGRKRILDAGCGGGLTASLLFLATTAEYVGADISESVDEAKTLLSFLPSPSFVQADMMVLPFAPGSFDTILAEGTLHHTPSTERALEALVPLLEQGGQILFYVYRKKAPAREFTDDHVRGLVSSLSPEAAWEVLRPLTALGKSLADLGAKVEVPEAIPFLGIEPGNYDVQRLLYDVFCKMYWNDELTFEENNHVNFDWFHPKYAHRQTEEEVESWCVRLGLSVVHRDIQSSGITIRAVRI